MCVAGEKKAEEVGRGRLESRRGYQKQIGKQKRRKVDRRGWEKEKED